VESRSRLGTFQSALRKRIITGVIVLVPLVVTFLALRLVFLWLDSFAQPLIKQILGSEDDIPGLGIVLTLVVVWLAGGLSGNVVGRRLIGQGDEFLARIPLIGSIYGPVKQFIRNVASAQPTTHFKRVVLAEYPSDDRWILGFATGRFHSRAGRQGAVCSSQPHQTLLQAGWSSFPRTGLWKPS
jgi:uncharacterized membrane protein